MAGHERIIRSSSWPSSLLFGPIWLRYFGISRGPQPEPDSELIERGTCLVWSRVNRLDRCMFLGAVLLHNEPHKSESPTTRHVGHAKTLMFVGVTHIICGASQCEAVQHCYLTTVLSRNRCANQPLGRYLASDWDLSVKTKGKALMDQRVRSSQTVLASCRSNPFPSCAIDSNSILHR